MSEQKILKVLIVDDSKLTVLGLRTTINQADGLSIAGESYDGRHAIKNAQELQPDIILMDIGMPVMDGIEATKAINQLNLPSKIIMLTSHDGKQDVLDAFSAGANSYCMKDVSPESLVSIIKTTFEGASWLDPQIARIVLEKFSDNSVETSKSNEGVRLTEREKEVLSEIADGCSNQVISNNLYISLNTVKTHIKNIFHKLEVDDRTKAAMKAVKENLL